MKKAGFLKLFILFVLLIGLALSGCEFLDKEEIPPDQLPPVPAACSKESNFYANALYGAYERAEVSQLQVARMANKFSDCLQSAGLSEAEARGIVRNQEKTYRDKLDGN